MEARQDEHTVLSFESPKRKKMSTARFLFSNGVVSHSSDTPPVSTFLESHPGAYTTTRTHNNATCLLFWERHLQRLANSARILFNSNPQLLFKSDNSAHSLSSLSMKPSVWESGIRSLVNDSVSKALTIALKESSRGDGEELAVTALVSGDIKKLIGMENVDGGRLLGVLDVCVHIGTYVPHLFGVRRNDGARLALVGRGRDVAAAKYSAWVRLRKPLEKLRPPLVTELLLSNDGDHILEGCITNFFVVCRKDNNEAEGKYSLDYKSAYSFEVQTAPISDGVLPGVIRELVIEVCSSKGIPVHEVAPSWSKHELWEEAFITNGLRVLKHVEMIRVPSSWESLESNCLEEISWKEKKFEEGPGMITKVIQKAIMEKADLEGYPLSNFT